MDPEEFIRHIQSPEFKEAFIQTQAKIDECVREKNYAGLFSVIVDAFQNPTGFATGEEQEEEEVGQTSNTEVNLATYGEVAIFGDGTIVVKWNDPEGHDAPVEIYAPGETPKE